MADETKTPVPATTKKKTGEKPAEKQIKLDSGTIYTAH